MLNYYIGMAEKQEIFTIAGGRVHMMRGRYNPTSDAVWLAAAAPTDAKSVLDVGIGTGGAALTYMSHNPGAIVTGIDISPEMLAECATNAELNNCNIELIHTDITTWRTARTFDLVITNPPYFKGAPAAHNAHHNADIPLWIRKCVARVRPRGTICVIVDALCLGDVVGELNRKCGDITIYPLYGANHPQTAERVIIRARLGTRGGAHLYAPIPMNYDAILRDGLTIADALSKLS